MEDIMNIYKLQRNPGRNGERKVIPVKSSALKRAAGGEDIVTLSDEAMERFRRESSVKDREEYLVKLALQHINDYSPELENPADDPEFSKAERLSLLAELVIRTSIPAGNRISYEKVADFVAEEIAKG
jgi:hypothetical protein